jgi:hypothetical protein
VVQHLLTGRRPGLPLIHLVLRSSRLQRVATARLLHTAHKIGAYRADVCSCSCLHSEEMEATLPSKIRLQEAIDPTILELCDAKKVDPIA